MARYQFLLITGALSLTAIASFADDSAPAASPTPVAPAETAIPLPLPPANDHHSSPDGDDHSPAQPPHPPHDHDKYRKAWEMFRHQPPDQHFQQNFKTWEQLSPDERDSLRREEAARHKRMEDEIDSVIKKLDLTLTPDQRQQFAFRYMQARRNIEEQLHKEMAEKRKTMIDQFLQQAKTDFSSPSPTPTPSPVPSAK